MLVHYITGLGILIAGGIHLATVFLTGPYDSNLAFNGSPFSVIQVYKNIILAGSLWTLLAFVDFHGMNGLRVVLIELSQKPNWQRAVTWILAVIGVFVLIYGTRTILLAYGLVIP